MAKKLREVPIYIASDIKGWIDPEGNPVVIDERNQRNLDPKLIDHKVIIYQRQVESWFLEPASKLIRYRNKNNGFIVLMICLSYIEGVEQFRRGEHSNGHSQEFFVSSMNRIYPKSFNENQLRGLYREARCGLFHNGMVEGKIIISNHYQKTLEFINEDILVNPKKFLDDIKTDFACYINDLQNDIQLRTNFDRMFQNF